MKVFFYDKSFEGLLSAVFDAYAGKVFPDALLGPEDMPPLLTQTRHTVGTSAEKADRVFKGLEKRLSAEALHDLFLAWLSEEAGSDFLLFQYMRLVFDSQKSLETDFSRAEVLDAHLLARKVGCEQHRLQGFLRFQKTREGLYCALIKPRHNVLPLLLRHFAERYAGQSWIIHDLGRNYGVLYDGREFREVSVDRDMVSGGRLNDCLLAEGETLIQDLWREYFSAASIRERTNKRLQARFMPRRYWAYLTEMR